MADEAIRMEDFPSWVLGQAAAHAQRLLAERLGPMGTRGYHFRLLVALSSEGPASQAALGRATGIHVSEIVAALNELTDGGFVERAPDPADRRRNVITITAAGRAHLDRLHGEVLAVQESLTAPLSTAEREQLMGLLRRIVEHQAGAA